ncbi:MAG: hypothetical protein SFW62_02305 [Alphaproteobacteria bacterium]|nr:hypothetical protein [Alphaproteobacteria bacterium]
MSNDIDQACETIKTSLRNSDGLWEEILAELGKKGLVAENQPANQVKVLRAFLDGLNGAPSETRLDVLDALRVFWEIPGSFGDTLTEAISKLRPNRQTHGTQRARWESDGVFGSSKPSPSDIELREHLIKIGMIKPQAPEF